MKETSAKIGAKKACRGSSPSQPGMAKRKRQAPTSWQEEANHLTIQQEEGNFSPLWLPCGSEPAAAQPARSLQLPSGDSGDTTPPNSLLFPRKASPLLCFWFCLWFAIVCISWIVIVMPDVRIPSGKREGFQDNATRKKRKKKKGSLLLTRVRAPAVTNAVVQGQRALSLSCYTNL